MDFKKIKEFIDLAKESGLAELSYESGDEKIKVKLPYGSSQALTMTPIEMSPTSSLPMSTGKEKKIDGLTNVVSPFVGTFYRSASPDSDAYVNVGDKVGNGQVLCIVEAMKIMNEIESDIQGEIVEICVENETYVEFGQVLFRIKK